VSRWSPAKVTSATGRPIRAIPNRLHIFSGSQAQDTRGSVEHLADAFNPRVGVRLLGAHRVASDMGAARNRCTAQRDVLGA
jgi:hypothetical protein